MRKYSINSLLIAFFLILAGSLKANQIDNLKTDKDVLDFLKSINADFRSDKFQAIELRSTATIRSELSCDEMAEKWQVNNWEKADLNADGHTDLVVILYWYDYGIYAVMDRGDDKYDLVTLSNNIFDKCELVKPGVINKQPVLLYYGKKRIADSLVYRYGNFVELNQQPGNRQIDSVEFRTGYCFGSCPVFEIRFDKNGNARYDAKTYNPKQGSFTAVVKQKDLNEIMDLINYLDISDLNDSYKVSWTDDQTAWLRVRYSDGSVKEIRDYGLKGTFGLRHLYSKFFSLRNNQDWR